jgi:hypothetical protein
VRGGHPHQFVRISKKAFTKFAIRNGALKNEKAAVELPQLVEDHNIT